MQQGKEITPEEAQRMYDVKTEIFHRMPVAEIFPGVLPLMQKIKDAGITIGVVTGSGQRPLFKRLLNDFDGFLISRDCARRATCSRGRASLWRTLRWEFVPVWLPESSR